MPNTNLPGDISQNSHQIEEALNRLERSLSILKNDNQNVEHLSAIKYIFSGIKQSGDDVKLILVIEMRKQHLLVLQSLDRTIELLDSQKKTIGLSENTIPGPYDSLVKRVEVALGNDGVPLSKSASATNKPGVDDIPLAELTLNSEMSMATYNYLSKYNLLENSLPSSPVSPPFVDSRQRRKPNSPRSHRVFSNVVRSIHNSKILDEDFIKKMPKL